MMLRNFELHASPFISNATGKCGNYCRQVSNGFLGIALFCPKCETVYELKMIKVPDKKVNEEFLKQCRKECKNVNS